MSLVRAERRRFLKRRLIKWLLVIAVALFAIIAAAIFLNNEKVSPQRIAAAEAQAQRNYEDSVVQWHTEHDLRCKSVTEGTPEADMCAQDMEPQREWFTPDLPSTFIFKKDFSPLITVWAALLAVIAFVIGASFVGAEWSTGSMMTLLTWRPRRIQVLSTKLAVLAGWLTAISAVSLALWTGAFWLTAQLRGSTDGMTSGTWQSLGLTGLRGLGLVLAVGIVGFLLATLGRHTGVALGVALGVIIVGQVGLGIVLGLLQVPFLEAYLLPSHLMAWMDKQYIVQNWSVDCTGPGPCLPETRTLTWEGTGSIALAAALVLAVVAFWQIKRRDIA
ncbi:hypothetical protein Cs7R123_37050 [Catellatospora sp. TT07R-123]|uniref:ABC transporter permease subunit n=1 Tax=Catellatospora sp. TT07R-123 TaxID=2733863 RepID=UPI001B198BD2|nr:ABC transporter permease subunit [Catellatospora sp. TT07R-123]GHJ46363.1 hypothetical protein Cs7R123_37050 [Catellatospora sp. TT07R-123]